MRYIFMFGFMLLIPNVLLAEQIPFVIKPVPAPTTPRVIVEIEENESLSSKGVKLQLKELAKLVEQAGNVYIYIISYGRQTQSGEASRRANQIKNYLVKTHGIEPKRIFAIDAGKREKRKIEIYLVPAGKTEPDNSRTQVITDSLRNDPL